MCIFPNLPAVVAMIGSAGISLFLTVVFGASGGIDWSAASPVAFLIFAGAFWVLRKWKVIPIKVMLGSGAAGGLLFSIFGV